jgi:hypothetical protein
LEVVEVPVPPGFVALEVLEVLVGTVLDVLVGDEVVVVVVVDVLLFVVLVLVLVLVEEVQSLAASWLTVPAPWVRFLTSVVVTEGGRFPTALVRPAAALCAAPHWPAATAEEIESSWPASVLL